MMWVKTFFRFIFERKIFTDGLDTSYPTLPRRRTGRYRSFSTILEGMSRMFFVYTWMSALTLLRRCFLYLYVYSSLTPLTNEKYD